MDDVVGMTNDVDQQAPMPDEVYSGDKPKPAENELAQVKKILRTIKYDKERHEKAFNRMRRDMFIAMNGREESWHEDLYAANIAGRHVKTKTNALYAKNPKAVARRRETLDFAIWDENPDSLMLAFQTIQMAQQAMAMAPPAMDPVTGGPAVDPMTGAPIMAEPQLPPGFVEAQALIADFQAGMERRKMAGKMGKTLEVLYSYFLREQKPIDFKMGMKQLVRRACTTSVGYIELGFQREYGPKPGLTEQLADARARLDHLKRLTMEAAEGEIEGTDAEAYELEQSIAALQAEGEIVLREGLVFDYLQSTKVIPDALTKSLVGFIGARHLTIEYLFTADEVAEMFPDAKLDGKYTGYTSDGKPIADDTSSANRVPEDNEGDVAGARDKSNGLVCVYKCYDKPSGLVYYVAEGHDCFLRPPGPPDVFVEDFWPVYALTFNAVESEKELFPLSDVGLLLSMQREYNRSRQGMNEHRKAGRPRWAYAKGRLSETDIQSLKEANPFDAFGLEMDGQTKLADILEAVPVPGVDPNLYGTEQYFTDVQFTVGSSEANFGGVAKATATESAIAANASASSDGSSVDDLDGFLSVVARAAGQILQKEMSPEKVMEIVGPGAVWPDMTLAQIADEIYLEIEAGSSGKPNQAVEVQNWTQMLPFLIQMPGVNPMWLAKETIRRLDDRLDLTEAIAAGMPSIVMQNQAKQPGTGDPASDPAAQGGQGADNAPAPPAEEQPGSDPAFGSNQVARPL
jgi:hypothetical protein